MLRLAALGDPQGLELLAALADPQAGDANQRGAARLLAKRGDARGLELLARQTGTASDDSARLKAIIALAELGTQEDLHRLRDIASQFSDMAGGDWAKSGDLISTRKLILTSVAHRSLEAAQALAELGATPRDRIRNGRSAGPGNLPGGGRRVTAADTGWPFSSALTRKGARCRIRAGLRACLSPSGPALTPLLGLRSALGIERRDSLTTSPGRLDMRRRAPGPGGRQISYACSRASVTYHSG